MVHPMFGAWSLWTWWGDYQERQEARRTVLHTTVRAKTKSYSSQYRLQYAELSEPCTATSCTLIIDYEN
jgi:hypothetical protein